MKFFPIKAYSLFERININERLIKSYKMYNIINTKPFDVSLRDGLQSLTKEQQESFKTIHKKMLYNSICEKYNPVNLEIGSCVNNKILPIFSDTDDIFNYVESNNIDQRSHYILVPNLKYLKTAISFGAKNFSFITSVSESFQKKNTKTSLSENYSILKDMMIYLTNEKITNYKVKVYVSCINECPIEGKIITSKIIDKLHDLSLFNFDKLCLSDTCGTLTYSDFINIIENIENNGFNAKNISLHLHVDPKREKEIEQIFHAALDYGINEFDVSCLTTGGCSLTMDKNKTFPNLTYEQYYKFLSTYMLTNH